MKIGSMNDGTRTYHGHRLTSIAIAIRLAEGKCHSIATDITVNNEADGGES